MVDEGAPIESGELGEGQEPCASVATADEDDDEVAAELAVSVMVILKGFGAYLTNTRQSTTTYNELLQWYTSISKEPYDLRRSQWR